VTAREEVTRQSLWGPTRPEQTRAAVKELLTELHRAQQALEPYWSRRFCVIVRMCRRQMALCKGAGETAQCLSSVQTCEGWTEFNWISGWFLRKRWC